MTSLVLAGALGALQVSSFFRVMGALGRRIGGTFPGCCAKGGGPGGNNGWWRWCGNNAAVLVLSFAMGRYLLACVTTVGANLPVKCGQSFSAAMGGGPNSNRLNDCHSARLTDAIFLEMGR
jgi:hypothetical protein